MHYITGRSLNKLQIKGHLINNIKYSTKLLD